MPTREQVQGSRLDAAPLPATIASRELLPPLIQRSDLSYTLVQNLYQHGLVRLALEPGLLCSAVRCHENASTTTPLRGEKTFAVKGHLVRPCLFAVKLGIAFSTIHPMSPVYLSVCLFVCLPSLPFCCHVNHCTTDAHPLRAPPQTYMCLTPCHLVRFFDACSNQVTEHPLLRGPV